MRVLVTGGAGFLGSRLVQSYHRDSHAVRSIGHAGGAGAVKDDRFSPDLEFVELDVCDLAERQEVFADEELVVHAAARVRAQTPEDQVLQTRVNVDGTRNVIEACIRNSVPRLIYVSSTATIGISRNPQTPADETFSYNLAHLDMSYGRSKRQAEQLIIAANGAHLETLVVNPGVILGPHSAGYRGQDIIGRFLCRPVITYTAGGLSLVHVDDVVDGIRRTADKGRPGERYILSGENVSFGEIARKVCEATARKTITIAVPNLVRDLVGFYTRARSRQEEPPLHLYSRFAYQFYDSSKAKAELGYNYRSFASIVSEALEYIKCSA